MKYSGIFFKFIFGLVFLLLFSSAFPALAQKKGVEQASDLANQENSTYTYIEQIVEPLSSDHVWKNVAVSPNDYQTVAYISQNGSGNTINFEQKYIAGATVGYVDQDGTDHTANLSQDGISLQAIITQTGSSNTVTVEQSGENSILDVTQHGTNLEGVFTQAGGNNNSLIIEQHGDGGNLAPSTFNQVGSNKSLKITLQGNAPAIHVSQSGF